MYSESYFPYNGDLSHIDRMRNGNILYNWRANIVVVNNILISPVNQNKWKTSDAKIWSEFQLMVCDQPFRAWLIYPETFGHVHNQLWD